MKFLVTNDDGIFSAGLAALVGHLRRYGEVIAIAPLREQSGKSHAIGITGRYAIREESVFPGVRAYSVDSTPADCVRYGILGLGDSFDFVFSGVNRGLNIGKDILYSGTVGAIFEGAALGIPALALSTERGALDDAVSAFPRVAAYFGEHRLWEAGGLYNVNIPPSPKDILLTRQGGAYYLDRFVRDADGLYRQEGVCVYQRGNDLSLDTDAVENGYISVTPLTLCRTDEQVYEKLKTGG